VLADTNGDLFGTTIIGGSTFAGTVFEVVKTATGYSSTPNFLAPSTAPMARVLMLA
jgi:hypothetical protein